MHEATMGMNRVNQRRRIKSELGREMLRADVEGLSIAYARAGRGRGTRSGRARASTE